MEDKSNQTSKMSTDNFADKLLSDMNIPYKGIDGMMKLLELKEEDVPENKRELLRLVKPVMQEFLDQWVNANEQSHEQ